MTNIKIHYIFIITTTKILHCIFSSSSLSSSWQRYYIVYYLSSSSSLSLKLSLPFMWPFGMSQFFPLLVQMSQSVTLTLSPVVGTNEAKCDTHTQSRCWYKWGKVWHSHSLPCLWWYCSSCFSPCYNRTSWLGVKHQVNSCVSWDERLGHLELLPLCESLGAGRARWG